ncbi:MAG: 4Fe-4S dicluster domain-containing protein [Candidatus Bathyarchaeia archaeon]
MPMKLIKTESRDLIKVERKMHARHYALTLDKNWCKGCGICVELCPREAIRLKPVVRPMEGRAEPPQIDLEVEKCHYCGICDAICPFGAFNLEIDGEEAIPVVKSESFPRLVRDVKVSSERCGVECVECEEACPLNLIKVSVTTPEGEVIKNRERLKVKVDIDLDHCPCCRICEFKCPEGLIQVKKIFHGILRINQDLCPENCRACLDVCPISGALYIEDRKVAANETFCVYCGACKVVCPIEGALNLQRTWVSHIPVKSGAWNRAVEKIASTGAVSKLLKTKALSRAKSSVEKRLSRRL